MGPDLCWFHQAGLQKKKVAVIKKDLSFLLPGHATGTNKMEDFQGSLETGDAQGLFFHTEESEWLIEELFGWA